MLAKHYRIVINPWTDGQKSRSCTDL